MTRTLKLTALIIATCAVGIATGELVVRSPICRDALGRMLGRGDLLAFVHGRGIYAADLASGGRVEDFVIAENMRWLSRGEPVAAAARDHEYQLLRSQFGDEEAFVAALRSSLFLSRCLRARIDEHLRAEHWIDNQIAPEIVVSDEECRQFYEAHRNAFIQPVRYRASHLFLAAPAETPPDLVEAKKLLIETFANQIEQHVDLSELAAQFSEDEATKAKGGDLGFFCVSRIPPEFFGEVAKLRIGETSQPFRSHLGFHILRLTDMKPSREMSFDEARAEIVAALQGEKRRNAMAWLVAGLKMAEYRQPQR